jgi:hypothetical protein
LQRVVFGKSERPFRGGRVVEQALTENELKMTQDQLMQELRTRLMGELTAEVKGARLREDLTLVETERLHASAQPGSFAQKYLVMVSMRARAFVADDNDLLSLTLLAVRNAPGPHQELLSYDPNSFSVKILRFDFDRGQAQIEGKLTGVLGAKVEPGVLAAEQLVGLTESEVHEHVRRFPSVGKAEVDFFPFWVNTVPSRRGAVTIVVEQKPSP